MAYKRAYSAKESGASSSSSGDVSIELDKKKSVTVRKFNGINLVDIREFYLDKESGEKKPGKKGISLTEETWAKLLAASSEIQAALDALQGAGEPATKKAKTDSAEKATDET